MSAVKQRGVRVASREEWYDLIVAMVARGVTFEAYEDGDWFWVELTGGY